MAILNCRHCKKEFKTYRLTEHGKKRKFCSYLCAMKAPWNTKEKQGNKNVSKRLDVRKKMSKARKGIIFGKMLGQWKGDNASYAAFHTWLKTHYGKAFKCENSNCIYPRKYASCRKKGEEIMQKPRRYEWALKKEFKHSHNREHYFMLCTSCHRLYDFNKLEIPTPPS